MPGKVGDIAPDFELTVDGLSTSLYSLLEKGPVILYFYPRDFTSGCTIQAKGFRDRYPDFQRLNATVVGISEDDESSHCEFQTAYSLPFPLVSDPDRRIAKLFGVRSFLGLMPERASFVVSADRRLVDVYRANLRFASHIDRTLKVLARLHQSGES